MKIYVASGLENRGHRIRSVSRLPIQGLPGYTRYVPVPYTRDDVDFVVKKLTGNLERSLWSDGLTQAEFRNRCVRPLRELRRSGDATEVYQVHGARLLRPSLHGTGYGTELYEFVLLQRARRAGKPVAFVADACNRGATTAAARKVYVRLHAKGYKGRGLVVSSTKKPAKPPLEIVRFQHVEAPYYGDYGNKLPTGRVAVLADGRKRRVWVTNWSNSGTTWVEVDKVRYTVHDVGRLGSVFGRSKR